MLALGAVQAQNYTGAKWALAQRARGATDAEIEREVSEGRILRTHVLRPTWHFVAPQDIRWMLALTAPRVRAAMAYYDRRLELDAAVFRRSTNALTKALTSGKHLTRAELGTVLERAGVICCPTTTSTSSATRIAARSDSGSAARRRSRRATRSSRTSCS